jgi:hypothetical protein
LDRIQHFHSERFQPLPEFVDNGGGISMTTNYKDERFLLEGQCYVPIAKKTLNKTCHCSINITHIDRATDNYSIGVLDFLVVNRQIIFQKTYLGFCTQLNTSLAS